jgi:hypothetical protein
MRPEFQVHLLNEGGLNDAMLLGEAFSRLLDEVESLIPEGREHALVLIVTKLQEASFFAKRALAMAPQNQK